MFSLPNRDQRRDLCLGHTGGSDVTRVDLARRHPASPFLKPPHYFPGTQEADQVPAEGGAEAEVGQEVGVAGGDEGDVREASHQAVQSVFEPQKAEGVVIGGDHLHHVGGEGQQAEQQCGHLDGKDNQEYIIVMVRYRENCKEKEGKNKRKKKNKKNNKKEKKKKLSKKMKRRRKAEKRKQKITRE